MIINTEQHTNKTFLGDNCGPILAWELGVAVACTMEGTVEEEDAEDVLDENVAGLVFTGTVVELARYCGHVVGMVAGG